MSEPDRKPEPNRRRGVIGVLMAAYRWSDQYRNARLALLGVCLILMPFAVVQTLNAVGLGTDGESSLPVEVERWVGWLASIYLLCVAPVGAMAGIGLMIVAAGLVVRDFFRRKPEQKRE